MVLYCVLKEYSFLVVRSKVAVETNTRPQPSMYSGWRCTSFAVLVALVVVVAVVPHLVELIEATVIATDDEQVRCVVSIAEVGGERNELAPT
jgi:hypothetical protein